MARRRGTNQPLIRSDLCIVLLGKTGAGKSVSGNTIIGGDHRPFREGFSAASVTRVCTAADTEVDGRTITVIDTVGLSDTLVTIRDFQTKIKQIFDCARHGLDVFLLVIRLGDTFTEESRKVVEWIKENFGSKLLRHTIVLFTHGDQLREPIDIYLNECEILRSVVDQCSGRYHVFNNRDDDRSQVTELLDRINTLKERNRNRRYTEQDYRETQDEILQRKYFTGAAVGGGAGGVGGAAAGAIAAKVGAIALTAGKAAVIGATGGAVLTAAAVCAGVFFLARRYCPIDRRP